MWGFSLMVLVIIIAVGSGLAFDMWVKAWANTYSDSSKRLESAATIVQSAPNIDTKTLNIIIGSGSKAVETAHLNFEDVNKRMSVLIDSVTKLTPGGSEGIAKLQNMKTLLSNYESSLTSLFGALKAGNDVSKEGPQFVAAAQALTVATNDYKAYETSINANHFHQLPSVTSYVLIIFAVLAVLGIGAGCGLGIGISRSIKRRLTDAVQGITTTASQLLAVSSQVAAGSAQTAASTNETTVTVEEVKQTALLAHEKASQVAESSENVARVAEAGRSTVDGTIAGIERMQAEMDVVAQTINRLSDQTQAVGDIVTTVGDLAEQSNLLSVNASIEAAKAGEHGKGFTVVAQEVKNLAEQSKQAAQQIRNILNEIQHASQTAVQAAEQGRDAVEAGRRQSLESGDAIQKLADTAVHAAQSAVQISASSRQQLTGMEQISQAIDSINEAGNQSVAGTRQVEKEVKQLQDLAFALRRLLDAGATA
jgi:hypothetical protein